jgi:hypothetical protein
MLLHRRKLQSNFCGLKEKQSIHKISSRGWHGLDISGSVQGQVVGSCECADKPLGSIKCVEFLE